MEEPPRIDRIISSQGVSLDDAASLLKSFLLNIDQYHGHHHHHRRRHRDDVDGERDIGDSSLLFDETLTDETWPTTIANTNDGGGRGANNDGVARRTWQEREEEALIAQMDQLAAGNDSATGVSDDVLERLGMITRSICAEAGGRPLSPSGVRMTTAISNGDGREPTRDLEGMGGGNDDIGDDDFPEEAGGSVPEERRRRERQLEQQERPREENMVVNATTNKDKKKEKKAKKAAKKAKKDAKRKARELDDSYEKNDSKRARVDT